MKTFNDYLRYVREMQKILDSEDTEELVRKMRSEGSLPFGYNLLYDLPIYPAHDNQLLFADLDIDELKGMMENLGFKPSSEITRDSSRWNYHAKGSFPKYGMDTRGEEIHAVVGHDPATIYFASFDQKTFQTECGLKVPHPEVQFLGTGFRPKYESRIITSLPLSSYVTLHPHGRVTSNRVISQQCEDVTISLLEQTMKKNANGFYGNFKSQLGVLHQVKE